MEFSFIYKHPGEYFILWINTVKLYCFPWLVEAIGTNAGYWQVFVVSSLPFALFMLVPTFVAGYSAHATEEVIINKKLLVISIIVTLVYLYVTPATVLRDNLVTNTTIEYCTGRYFLPLFPLIFTVIVSLFSKPKQKPVGNMIILGSYLMYTILMCFVAFFFKQRFF